MIRMFLHAPAKLLLIAFLLLSLSGCDYIVEKGMTLFLEPGPPAAPEGTTVERDIVFTMTPDGPLYLDVYLPATPPESPLPVILFLFGGGWEVGNRHQMRLYDLQDYPLDGYAVVSADYRYSSTALFPAQIHDAKAAVRWIRDNASQYGFDGNRVGVMGPSAGGHLAALLGTSGDTPALDDDNYTTSSRVQAVVDLFGPTDFLQANAHAIEGSIDWDAADSGVSKLVGAPIQTVPDKVMAANPLAYIDGSEPPFLIVHGDEDTIVPLHQSILLDKALHKAGALSQLVVVKGGGHGFGGEFFSDRPATAISTFFAQQLKGQSP